MAPIAAKMHSTNAATSIRRGEIFPMGPPKAIKTAPELEQSSALISVSEDEAVVETSPAR